jgi:protocatechuate 3,4-dioxygenase beta subunit
MSSSSSKVAARSALKAFAAREKSRRDFLGWLAAGTAMAAVGCAASPSDEEYNGQRYDGDGEDAIDVSEQGQHATTCRVTSRDARGPYFEPGAPYRPLQIADAEEPGVRLFLGGRILGPDCRTPLKDYVIDLWQADAEGNYYRAGTSNYRLRGKIKADATGRYRLETILPGRYGDAAGIRPAHLHVSFLTPGGNVLLTTQLYFAGDPYLGEKDYCTAAQVCNSADPARALKLADTTVRGVAGKQAWFDANLPRT